MISRRINNKIHLLENHKDKLRYTNEINYIINEFNCYREILGEIVTFEEYVEQKQQLSKIMMNIDDKLDEIRLHLYT